MFKSERNLYHILNYVNNEVIILLANSKEEAIDLIIEEDFKAKSIERQGEVRKLLNDNTRVIGDTTNAFELNMLAKAEEVDDDTSKKIYVKNVYF